MHYLPFSTRGYFSICSKPNVRMKLKSIERTAGERHTGAFYYRASVWRTEIHRRTEWTQTQSVPLKTRLWNLSEATKPKQTTL